MPGKLILVVGPSGAGKDSLMEGARRALDGDPRFHFARRVVTRPSLPGAEDHDSLDVATFVARAAEGAFLLHWQAHGLHYGIPVTVAGLRQAGVAVVVNVSRAVVDVARRDLAPVGVVVVTAPPDVLAARLAGRGRESVTDIRQRLVRAAADLPTGTDVRLVMNDRGLEQGVASFLAALHALCGWNAVNPAVEAPGP